MKKIRYIFKKDDKVYFDDIEFSDIFEGIGEVCSRAEGLSEDYNIDISSADFVESVENVEKLDINNKDIYADSSIIEFRCDIWGNSISPNVGHFEFNSNTLRYVIVSLCGRRIPYDMEYIHGLKIIDTIQENKLGLIK